MAGDVHVVKSVQTAFDKIYNDRIVKQSAERKKLNLDKQKLRRLLKQRHSQQVSEEFHPFQKESDAEKLRSTDEGRNKTDDRKLWASKQNNNLAPQENDNMQSVLGEKGRRGPDSESVTRKSFKLITKEKVDKEHHTRTDRQFESGNGKKTGHTSRGYYTVGNHLDQQCGERDLWMGQHSQKAVLHKTKKSWDKRHSRRQKPYSSLFSKFHAGPVRQSIVNES